MTYPWTNEEMEVLKEKYPLVGSDVIQLSKHSKGAIRAKANKLGIKCDLSKRYSGIGNTFYGRHHSITTKEKDRIAHIGKIQSLEHINKKKIIMLMKYADSEYRQKHKKACQSYSGGKHSETTRKKQSDAIKKKWQDQEHRNKKIKENHWNWQGGIGSAPYSIDFDELLKESIRIRDNYRCQCCNKHQSELIGFLKKLDIHHIDYDKLNANSENLISICRSCHIKTNYHKEHWKTFFQKKLEGNIIIQEAKVW